MPETNPPFAPVKAALIGFGEAGEAFARAGRWGGRVRGWDILSVKRSKMAEHGVEQASNAAEALRDCSLALSLVTADQALLAARETAANLEPGALWCDMNSVAPQTKREAAAVIEAAGGHYVDIAVMAPVDQELAVPLLLSGSHAARAEALLQALGFSNTRIVGNEVGRASAIKMIRSVMVKGLEALSSECMAAAEAAGVLDEITASLDASEKAVGWAGRFAYNRERMDTHGLRRAAEMEEVCKTLVGLGVEPVMSEGTVKLQRRAGEAAKIGKDQAA